MFKRRYKNENYIGYIFGGMEYNTGSQRSDIDEYDSDIWTSKTNLPTARVYVGGASSLNY